MKIAAVTVLVVLCSASFQASATFTCEQIKEKKARTACIEDRVSKEKADSEEKEKAANAAREKEISDQKAGALDDFVSKSKAALTKYYKDPAGAQYKDLIVSDGRVTKSLCGSVNGKNSYGAFTGFKQFYVQWIGNMAEPSIWNEGESTKNRRASDPPALRENTEKILALENDLLKMACGKSETNTITQVP